MKTRCHARLGARTRTGTSPRGRAFRTTRSGTAVAAPADTFNLLLETGDHMLTEAGDNMLTESAP